MPHINKLLIVFSAVLLISSSIKAQTESSATSAREVKDQAEKLLGMDDLLVNGKRYLPEHTKVVGNPEFEFQSSDKSAVFIKGQPFDNIILAYDIVSDHLILVQTLGNGLENRIEMYRSFVDSFVIGNHFFINPANIFGSSANSGYYEKVSSGRIMFLKRYRKTFVSIYDNQNRGKYSPQLSRNYLVNSSGTLVPVNSKRAFLNYFPMNKKNIRNFMSENDISLKNADNSEIRRLMLYCNSLADEIR